MSEKEKTKKIDSFLRGAEESRREPEEDRYYGEPPRSPRRGGSSALMGAAFVIFLLLVVGGVAWVVKEMKGIKGGGERIIETIRPEGNSNNLGMDGLNLDQGKYQAVFLTNGQVYFGKVNKHNLSYVELIDIYYLQVKPILQQKEGEKQENQNNNNQQQTELSLVKLGNELHGPLDRMQINKDQIVFIEDLKDDGKVVDAIKRYQNGERQ